VAEHVHDRPSPRRALLLGLLLACLFVAAEAITGVLAGSLALLSDAGHTLADSAGLLLALAATTASRRPADTRRTYGYARFEVLAVPVHVTLLLGIAAYIIYEAVGRIGGSHSIDPGPVLGVGAAGLVANLVTMRLLHSHAEENLNARAAMLEAAADAAGSVAVLISATIIALGGWQGIDAVAGLLIGAFIIPRAVRLLRQSADILLESAPPGLDPAVIVQAGNAVPGVLALHDVHVWSIAPHFPALSAHVEIEDVRCTEHILTELTSLLRQRFGIGHVTLQPETRLLHEAIACCEGPDSALIDPGEHIHASASH
jgi:cobalt-zinc-cadmium efflux system protein